MLVFQLKEDELTEPVRQKDFSAAFLLPEVAADESLSLQAHQNPTLIVNSTASSELSPSSSSPDVKSISSVGAIGGLPESEQVEQPFQAQLFLVVEDEDEEVDVGGREVDGQVDREPADGAVVHEDVVRPLPPLAAGEVVDGAVFRLGGRAQLEVGPLALWQVVNRCFLFPCVTVGSILRTSRYSSGLLSSLR